MLRNKIKIHGFWRFDTASVDCGSRASRLKVRLRWMLQSISLNQQLTFGSQNLNHNVQFMNVRLVGFFRNNRTRTQQLPQF